ncbi:hypothetical protein SHI21_13520 [Bacteriovorax sp. PP10]|uniref:Uncharacterized protein n=1 Tax=Bacteriovorax antarcticus TaxID=3088717 RepID=A0ABU5VVZ6_9BACT|nr:hypothetical protein [Bacteriovorax sp. PP10]MEA9357238.1 hypothetical protein [Bacteriovorax sp. PP10]
MVAKAAMSKKGNKRETKALERDYADSYSKFKEFEDRRYAGMKNSRSRKWHYEPADWIEKTIAQEEWEINYKNQSGEGCRT